MVGNGVVCLRCFLTSSLEDIPGRVDDVRQPSVYINGLLDFCLDDVLGCRDVEV